jgi:hypothetical protein
MGVFTSTIYVNGRTFRWNERKENKCFTCNGDEKETVEHSLIECDVYKRERQFMMKVILNEGGEINSVL